MSFFVKIVYTDDKSTTYADPEDRMTNHAMLNDTLPIGLSALCLENVAHVESASSSNVVCVSQRERVIDELNVCVRPKNESLGNTSYTMLSDSDNDDLPDIHTLYIETLKKSTKLEKIVKDLTEKVSSL